MWFEYFLKILHQRVRCTLYNPTSRLATGHRSAQRPYGAPREGGALEKWMKERRKETRGCNRWESPPPPNIQWTVDFMLFEKQSGQNEGNTLWICEHVNVCTSHSVWVCVTLSVWEELEVLSWATERCQMFLCEVEEGLTAGQCRGSNPCFFHSFLPSSPCFPVRFLFLFCCCFCIYNCERKLNYNEREKNWLR